MKHTLIPFFQRAMASYLLIAAGGAANAQSFQLSDFVLPVGFPFYSHLLTSPAPMDLTPGVGEVWNFSTLQMQPDSNGGVVSIAPPDAPMFAMFPETDVVIRRPVDPLEQASYLFLEETGSSLSAVGHDGGSGLVSIYTDHRLEFTPVDLGDTLIDPWCSQQIIPGEDTIFSCGIIAISFSSAGTLQLPYGVFPGTRLLTRRITSGTEPNQFDVLEQSWFIPGSAQPALLSLFVVQDGDVTFQSGSMLTAATVQSTGIREEWARLEFTCFPNPATDRIRIERGATGSGTLEVHAADGRVFIQEQMSAGTTTHMLDISALGAGPYFVELVTTSGRSSKVFVKQ